MHNIGNHAAPNSVVVSVALGLLNADLWRQWGVTPSIVLGHSIGEVVAAYASGIFTATEAIQFGLIAPPCERPLWGASSQAHDRLVLSTLRLSGPLWASLGLSQQPASPPAFKYM